jgi:hypothetical protein
LGHPLGHKGFLFRFLEGASDLAICCEAIENIGVILVVLDMILGYTGYGLFRRLLDDISKTYPYDIQTAPIFERNSASVVQEWERERYFKGRIRVPWPRVFQ